MSTVVISPSQIRNLKRTVIKGNKTWVYVYDSEIEAQSSQWKSATSPRPKKKKKSRDEPKVSEDNIVSFLGLQGLSSL